MDLARTTIIFINTLQKEFRSKVLLFLLVITVVIITLAALVLNHFSDETLSYTGIALVGEKALMMFFLFINYWCILLSTFFAVNCIRSDFENGVMPQLLAFPIRRDEYLFARIAGTWIIIMGYYIFSLILATITFSIASGVFIGRVEFLYALGTTGLSIMAVILISVLLSFYLPKMVSLITVSILTFFISITSTVFSGKEFDTLFQSMSVIKALGLMVYFAFPRIDIINKVTSMILTKADIPYNLPYESIHYVVTSAAILFTLKWVFNRKNV